MTTRRRFLASLVAVGVLGSTGAKAASAGEFEDDGDEITRTAPMDELRTYMPYLRFDHGSPSKSQLIGLYGWKAESPDHDTDAYYYWARYTHQHAGVEHLGILERAFGVLASDAHLWDHEPSITFVDPDTGEVEDVVYTAGHHAVGTDTDPPLIEDATDHPTHVSLRVIDPWHHYRPDEDKRGVDTRNLGEFGSWLEERPRWIDNGFYENSQAEAIDNPWTARDSESWFSGRRDRLAARMWSRL